MLTVGATLIFVLGSGIAQLPPPEPLPDDSQIFVGNSLRPNISLVLDTSGSMDWGDVITQCQWYANASGFDRENTGVGDLSMDKMDMLRAVMLGCEGPTDNLLDRWGAIANFSVSEFGD